MPDSPDDADEAVPDRKHPHRLDDDAYSRPGASVFITTLARPNVLLTAPHVAAALTAAIRATADARGVRVTAYCIMPDHLHVVVSAGEAGCDVAAWLRYMKRETAKRLHQPGMWQRSFWDHHARSYQNVVRMVGYVLGNPVRQGLCQSWEEWPHSWSRWHEREDRAG